MKSIGVWRADLDPGAQCSGEIANHHCRFVWLGEPFGEHDAFGVFQAVSQDARDEILRRLRWMPRHTQRQRLVDVSIDVGELDIEVIDRCGESHSGRRKVRDNTVPQAKSTTPQSTQVFLLSPARCDGGRARILLNPNATFAMAERLRAPGGAPLGEVFAFLSGLYFRGKLAYANAYGKRSRGAPTSFVITTNRGLVSPDVHVQRDGVLAFRDVDIAAGDERYLAPLRRDAERLDADLDPGARIVLLGSIATGKYTDVLLETFGDRLLFPVEFVGRGDMSRGGLLLRCARDGRELSYAPVVGATRRGKRPPKLERIR